MHTLSRKQREIREREDVILGVARRLLVRHGPAGLGLGKIAEELDYSRGTLYQHFRSKEDVLGALAAASLDARVGLFDRAALFSGRPRERMTAIGEAASLFVRLHPLHSQIEQLVRATPREKMEPDRRSQIDSRERRCFEIVMGVLRDAVAEGDLVAPDPASRLAEMAFGLWSLHAGAHLMMTSGKAVYEGYLSTPNEAVRRSTQAMFDGLDWRPLSSDLDYAEVCRNIERDLFGSADGEPR